MTARRDPDQFINAYLEDGLTELPDRAYDAVRSEIDHTRQRVVIGPWRVPYMNNYARYGIAAAAIVLVAAVGINLWPKLGIGAPGATPTLSPTPSPLAAVPLTEGALAPGTYYADDTRLKNVTRMTFTVPTGWAAGPPQPPQGSLNQTPAILYKDVAEPGGLWLDTWLVDAIYADVCHWRGTDTPVGPTAADLATALAAQTGREPSTASDVTLGGYPAKRIVTLTPDQDPAFCDGGSFFTWPGVGPNTELTGMGANVANQIDVVYAADVAGKRLVIVASHVLGTSEQDLAELNDIIASIEIEP